MLFHVGLKLPSNVIVNKLQHSIEDHSNLIEGHNTRPRDIERALENDFDTDATRRDLQLEARAHVRVQREIDRLHVEGSLGEPASSDFLRWVHREFYRDAPDSMLVLADRRPPIRIQPGEFRSKPEHDVVVGRHQPPSSRRVAEFMAYFADRYRFHGLGSAARIVAMAAAHHRLNYIHPFLDGNGRVSRLMSHAMGLEAGIGAHGLWSVSRGLARGLTSRTEYKTMMDAADSPREHDTDGRGNLSLRRLREFVVWFLRVCLDQVRFMAEMFALESLRDRLRAYAARESLRPEAAPLLEEVFLRGQLPRGEATRVTGLAERSGRKLLGELVKSGILASSSPKGPVSLRFPISAAEVLFPRLFPVT